MSNEQALLMPEDVHTAFKKNFPKSRISQAWINFATDIHAAIVARQALSLPTAAPVGERELPPVIAYRLDYPASEGVGLPRFFGADDGERAHTFAFNHKATITELCDRATLPTQQSAVEGLPDGRDTFKGMLERSLNDQFLPAIDAIMRVFDAWNESADLHSPATAAVQQYKEDAQRYRLVRRGQHFSIINGIGDTLRGEALDAAIDAAMRKGQL